MGAKDVASLEGGKVEMMKEMAQNKHAKTAPTTTPEDIVIEGAIEVSHTKSFSDDSNISRSSVESLTYYAKDVKNRAPANKSSSIALA